MLSEVVMVERVELEQTRVQLINQISDDQTLLSDLEDKTLKQISEVKGHILV